MVGVQLCTRRRSTWNIIVSSCVYVAKSKHTKEADAERAEFRAARAEGGEIPPHG